MRPLTASVVLLWACSTPSGPSPPAVQSNTPGPLLVHIPAEVRSAEASPKRVSPDGKTTITLLAEGHNAFMGKLEIAPHDVVPEHQEPSEEYLHVLSGHAQVSIDGKSYSVAPGTTLYMPAYTKVSVQNGDEPLIGLQVFAGPAPARKYDHWSELE